MSAIFRVRYVAVRWLMRTDGRARALLGATALGRSTFALIQHRSQGMLCCTAVRFSLLSVLGLQMKSMKSKHGDYSVSHTKQRGLLGEGMRLTISDPKDSRASPYGITRIFAAEFRAIQLHIFPSATARAAQTLAQLRSCTWLGRLVSATSRGTTARHTWYANSSVDY